MATGGTQERWQRARQIPVAGMGNEFGVARNLQRRNGMNKAEVGPTAMKDNLIRPLAEIEGTAAP